ncbi:MAG: molybdate ABC transporter permease subunit [Spirochaetota bacterium]
MTHADIAITVFLSIRFAVVATTLNVPVAFCVARIMARRNFRGKGLVDGLVNLPLVMPPVTTGYLLLFVFGRNGFVGGPLFSLFGVRIAFTGTAATIAAMVVSFPLVVRSIRGSMDMVDARIEEAAMTLGANRLGVLLRVTLPLVSSGVANGAVLGFARGLGEFGATMVFAGNIQGRTRTIPLSVYSLLQVPGGERGAVLLVALSIGVSLVALVFSATTDRRRLLWSKAPHVRAIPR